ncbi:hypothetical protein BDZ89DRAFT_1057928 [Hymenopellis radicata]|nr:hypothetical protein BDZ89DRAFT_1057928 [Hymenopellis radicata]
MASRTAQDSPGQQASMIGTTTTYYDPDAVQHSGGSQTYQQWTEAYHQQQQPQQQQQQHVYQHEYPGTFEYSFYDDHQPYQQQSHPQPAQPVYNHHVPSQRPPSKPAAKSPQNKRKRAQVRESESDSEDDGGIMIGGISGGNRGGRLPGACTHCKKLKMKCDFPPNDNTCKRCKGGGHVCIVEGRKPRTAPNKREYLLAQIRQKDAIIESLLKQLHNPYLATPLSIASYRMATSAGDTNNRSVIQWLDKLQASVQSSQQQQQTAFSQVRNSHDDSDEEETSRENPSDESGEDGEPQTALPDSHVPLGLIANLSLTTHQSDKKGKKTNKKIGDDEAEADDDNVGVANETYFMPGPATNLDKRAMLIEQHSPPEILVHGLVAPSDVDELFKIFYERVNPFISLLDPALHTPQTTFTRCPFLFTVICAISSRYHPPKSSIYPIAMHFAKHSAANALIDGWKSVELCQAYILMSIYAVPARRWEEDRSWLYTGLAIRIATDLNLHQAPTTKPKTPEQEREQLNRHRVWQICFNLDRSTATQFGKPTTIREDGVIRGCAEWYHKSKYNLEYDVHMCAYTVLLRIVARFHDQVFARAGREGSGTVNMKKVDFKTLTPPYDEELAVFKEEWERRFRDMRCQLLPFLVAYSRLVMFSFGFQQAYSRGMQKSDDMFFNKCLDSAKTVIRCMVEELIPSGFMRFAPDGHFIFASFASAFLLKLLRPEFQMFRTKADDDEIFDLIGTLIQKLSSSNVAIDERHTPKLYARFLAGLLSKYKRDGWVTVGRLQTIPPPGQTQGASGSGSYQSYSDRGVQQYGGYQQQHPHQSVHNVQSQTPIYRPEATYAGGSGAPIHFGGDLDFEWNFDYSNGNVAVNGVNSGSPMQGTGDEVAAMQALKNPAWWNNMMMPGFQWEAGSPGSESTNSASPPTYSGGRPMMSRGIA